MEEKKNQIVLEDRRNLHLTGIQEIVCFLEDRVELVTALGNIQITGSDLHMDKLDLEKGEAMITGLISSLYYPESGGSEKKKLLSKLFS